MTTNQLSTKTLNQRTYYAKNRDKINQKRRNQYQPKKIGLSFCLLHNLKYYASNLKCSKCKDREYFKLYRQKHRTKLNENSLRYYHRKSRLHQDRKKVRSFE